MYESSTLRVTFKRSSMYHFVQIFIEDDQVAYSFMMSDYVYRWTSLMSFW